MQINNELLHKIKKVVKKQFDVYLNTILKSSVSACYGNEVVDTLHSQLPETKCGNCGRCCNSISMYSLEYHRIIRYIMSEKTPEEIRKHIFSGLRFDLRQAEIGKQNRIRCTFRDEKKKTCLIHPIRPFACRIFGLLKEDGTRECNDVSDLYQPDTIVTNDLIESLQVKILQNSESFEVFPNFGKIHFFPFEFWLYRHLFSSERALQIYKEILLQMSTPLTNLWKQKSNFKEL